MPSSMMTLHIDSVGADAHGQVVVGVDSRRAVVGRDGDDLAAAVAGLGDEVIPGDGGVDGVVVPDDDQLRVEPVVGGGNGVELAPGEVESGAPVLELGVPVGDR